MSPEEFDALQAEKREMLLERWQDERRWGGNKVPRGEIRPSYRIAVEMPMDRPITQGITDNVVIQSYGPPVARYDRMSLVEDLRYRGKRGNPERILEPIDDEWHS